MRVFTAKAQSDSKVWNKENLNAKTPFLGARIMADIWDRKYQEFKARCVYCGKDLFIDMDAYMGATLDHLIPSKANGEDKEDNLVLACSVCNNLKHDFDPRQKGGVNPSRDELIELARTEIFERRAKKTTEFFSDLKKYEITQQGR
ncbi:MAG: HNH endonuclease signature motif containing protein [Kiritimatiellales bacterium]